MVRKERLLKQHARGKKDGYQDRTDPRWLSLGNAGENQKARPMPLNDKMNLYPVIFLQEVVP